MTAGRPPKLYEYQGQMLTLRSIAKRSGIKLSALTQRLLKGWSMEDATTIPVSSRRSVKRLELDLRALTFAIEHPGGATHEQIAEVLGTSRARVQQIEAQALRKLELAIKRKHRVHTYEEAAE